MRECEGFIKHLGKKSASKVDDAIRTNIQRQLAMKLQELTQKQRNTQRLYMEKLKKLMAGDEDPRTIELMPEDRQLESQMQESESDWLDDMEEISRERDESINTLVNNLNELAMIFKDLADLVLHQGTILDRIDYNIEKTLEATGKAVKELTIAEKRQSMMRATCCLLSLIVLVVVMCLALIFKYV